MSAANTNAPWPADLGQPTPPQLIPWRVLILSAGDGHAAEDIVFATSAKQALAATIENMPENHPAWQWPGWRDVQIHPMRGAFIVGAITGGRS